MARTNRATAKFWIVEGLKTLGGRVEFDELVEHLEKEKANQLSSEDFQTQQGHPDDTRFKYMCRWAVTDLIGDGIIMRGSPRGWVEFKYGINPDDYQQKHKTRDIRRRKSERNALDGQNFVGTSINAWKVTLAGKQITPRNWRELLVEVATWIGKQGLQLVLNKKRGKWPIVIDNEGPIPSKYTDIPNTEYRLYVHANADLIVRLAKFLLEETGNDSGQLVIGPNLQGEKSPHVAPKPKAKVTFSKKNLETSPRDRHRTIFEHLRRFGEITTWEADSLGIRPHDIEMWIDSLVSVRPSSIVATPLFFKIAKDNDPKVFAIRIASEMMRAPFEYAKSGEIPNDLEGYIWSHFGGWHIDQPYVDEKKWHEYLKIPSSETLSISASEKLDLFAHLPPETISGLIRDTVFLNEQQTWSAQAANKNLGPLSRQLKSGIKRPLILSNLIFPTDDEGEILLYSIEVPEILKRYYVVSGLPLCSIDQWQENLHMTKEDIVACVLEHPLYAIIVQFEVQRLMAGLSNEFVIKILKPSEGKLFLESDNGRKPLWQTCRRILEELGFWPVNDAAKDENWINAIDVVIQNLEILDVLKYQNCDIRFTESFASHIKAHPSHSQNRGEKAFRLYLAKQIENIMKGE